MLKKRENILKKSLKGINRRRVKSKTHESVNSPPPPPKQSLKRKFYKTMEKKEEEEISKARFSAIDVSTKVKALVKEGKINTQYWPSMNTILHKSVFDKKPEVIFYLIGQKNLKINISNKEGDTALHVLARTQGIEDEVFIKMVKAGAKLNVTNNNFRTPFMELFINHRSKDLIAKCLKLGGNIKQKDKNGNTIIFYLVDKCSEESITSLELIFHPYWIYQKMLLLLDDNLKFVKQFKKDFVINVNYQNNNGDTLLHLLCEKADLSNRSWNHLFHYFMTFPDLDVNIKNNNNEKPIDLLVDKPLKEMVKNYAYLKVEDKSRGHVRINTQSELLQKSRLDKSNDGNYKSFHYMKGKVYEELINTEEIYCRDITFLLKYYFEPLLTWKKNIDEYKMYTKEGTDLKEIKEIEGTGIFQLINSVQLIQRINSEFYQMLIDTLNNTRIFNLSSRIEIKILTEFTKNGKFGKLMEYYLMFSQINKNKSELNENKYLKKYLREKDENLGLFDSYLIKPIQRLPRYILMIREVSKVYRKHKVNTRVNKVMNEALDYVKQFVTKIDQKRLFLLHTKHTLTIAKYFKEYHQKEILEGKQKKYIFHDMELPVLMSRPNSHTKKLKLFIFDTVLYLCFKNNKFNKDVLVEVTQENAVRVMLKIMDNSYFSIRLFDEKKIEIEFLVRYTPAYSLISLFKNHFFKGLVNDDKGKYLLLCMDEKSQILESQFCKDADFS